MLRHLYLSPHSDDAVLSCGGLIARQAAQGDRVLVATICAAKPDPHALSPFAQFQHQRWLARHPGSDLIDLRRAEDEAACAQLGAEVVFLHELDCIYRPHPVGGWMYDSEASLWGDLHPADDSQALHADLETLLHDFRPDAIYAPLAVGDHVDHQVARALATAWAQASWPIWFYEDYPYSENSAALWRALNRPAPGVWQRHPQFLTTAQAAAKMDAIACYDSQMDVLFAGRMRERVSAHLAQMGAPALAEVLWKLVISPAEWAAPSP